MALDVYKDWLGIPEGPRPPDHYALLRLVPFEDEEEKVRKNYKKLNAHVRKYATGQYSVQSQDLLNELAKAMLCLTDVARKREYDRGLGREFEEEKTSTGRPRMETVLIKEGQISDSQAQEAKQFAEKTGMELRDAMVQLKLVDAATAARALSVELGIPYIDLSDIHPDDDVLDRVPKSLVRQHSFLPLFVDDDMLLVACTHLIELDLEEELRLRLGVPVRSVLADPKVITQTIAKYYAPGVRQEINEPLVAGKAPVTPTKGTTAKSKEKEKPAAKKEQPKVALTKEEQAEQAKKNKQIFIIAVCWSFFSAYLLDNFVISPGEVGTDNPLTALALYTLIPGPVAFIGWLKLLKK